MREILFYCFTCIAGYYEIIKTATGQSDVEKPQVKFCAGRGRNGNHEKIKVLVIPQNIRAQCAFSTGKKCV